MENKKNSSLLTRMNPYLTGLRLPFVLAGIGATIASVITVYGPRVLKEITEIITQGLTSDIDVAAIGRWGLFLAGIYALAALVGYLQAYLVTTVIQRFSQRLRTAIATKINRLPLNYFDSHSQGDTLSRVTNDVDMTGQALNQSLGTIVSSSLLLVGSVIMMFVTNAVLAGTAIASVVIGFVLSLLLMTFSRRFFKAQQENLAAINGFVEESYSGHAVVTSYNAVTESRRQFEQLNGNLYGSMWKSQFISGIMMPLMLFIGNFGYVMVCVVGAMLVLNGHATIGIIVAFMTYVRLFSQPLSQLAQAFGNFQQASAAMDRVFEFLEEPEMEEESQKTQQLQEVKGEVVFDKVSFGYLPDQTIIHQFSAQARPGQKIAIVGPTGAGKTTIVNLLMRFYEINQGRISIDGVDTREMFRAELHDYFSMVLQDTWLFEGSIRENLLYNQEGLTDQDMIAATKAVGVHHFITTLPEGYETILDDSVTLSVGQKQLLTIARALLKNAPLLILDEATSSVDTRTEELIQQAMDRLMEGRTSFVIAHRLSTIRNASLILVMKEGNIIEQGTHQELMDKAGFYADLYNSQFTEETDDQV